MEAYVFSAHGERTSLPVLLGWDVVHSALDCDAFELAVPLAEGLSEALETAAAISCTHEGMTVFTGVVDEYELRALPSGGEALISGRGYAAYLLDNEAESAEYWNPGIELILERHVYPWRITDVEYGRMECRGRFSISSGTSQWKVLREFCMFAAGTVPRFDRSGRLILTGAKGGEADLSGAPVIEERYLAQRSGVFSHVLVKNSAGVSSTVENPRAAGLGLLCRRVVNVPRSVRYDTMRSTGEYQIEQSERLSRVLTVTLPLMFPAFAGDTVRLAGTPLGTSGRFFVAESRCRADGGSGETVLRLTREE